MLNSSTGTTGGICHCAGRSIRGSGVGATHIGGAVALADQAVLGGVGVGIGGDALVDGGVLA
ncbi:hypothetical protein [Arthrobacter sedimenti]|uniref:Uncharacterized protein n=1 Tax=Arthrobacter sedimenti TaxID=2694931 RepID=A0ABV8WGJ9_9MICC